MIGAIDVEILYDHLCYRGAQRQRCSVPTVTGSVEVRELGITEGINLVSRDFSGLWLQFGNSDMENGYSADLLPSRSFAGCWTFAAICHIS